MSSWTAGRLDDARVAVCLPKLLSEFLSLFFLFNLVGFSVANVLVNVAAAREKGEKHKQSKNRLWETDKGSKRWSLLPVVQLMASHRAAQIRRPALVTQSNPPPSLA